ncbi:MAG: hypothetical protein K0Q50_2646 [Vampirovibrio sp.]|jgi:hypothetical protein|nr:hypothetical protein [Vampirovibrio sp.]
MLRPPGCGLQRLLTRAIIYQNELNIFPWFDLGGKQRNIPAEKLQNNHYQPRCNQQCAMSPNGNHDPGQKIGGMLLR